MRETRIATASRKARSPGLSPGARAALQAPPPPAAAGLHGLRGPIPDRPAERDPLVKSCEKHGSLLPFPPPTMPAGIRPDNVCEILRG